MGALTLHNIDAEPVPIPYYPQALESVRGVVVASASASFAQ
jgi:hypothetical protein